MFSPTFVSRAANATCVRARATLPSGLKWYMHKHKPNPSLIALLSDLLAQAQRGEIVELYTVTLDINGEYDDAYESNDIQLLISEVQQLALRARILAGKIEDRSTGRHH